MVAPRAGGATIAIFAQRCAAKFRAPRDHSAIEHSALFEVLDECGDGLVHRARVKFQFGIEIAVVIPRGVNNVNDPHTAFHESPREQAVACKILICISELSASTAFRFGAI